MRTAPGARRLPSTFPATTADALRGLLDVFNLRCLRTGASETEHRRVILARVALAKVEERS